MDNGTSTQFGPPEEMYCAEQIEVPPSLPEILKNYTKAAIRTQPSDLFAWSASYFTALQKGDTLPVKYRPDMPHVDHSALTERALASLHLQLGDKQSIAAAVVKERWEALGVGTAALDNIMRLGGWPDAVVWLEFLILSCGSITTDLKETMKMFCRIYSHDDPGAAARIPIDIFVQVFSWIAGQDAKLGSKQRDDVITYMKDQASKAAGMVGPRNIDHRDCPRLT